MTEPPHGTFRRDRRSITTILNYALLLVVVTLLVAGLFVGVSGLVESQQERAIRSQLDTVGHSLATDIGTADRLVATTGGDDVNLSTELPDTVGGSQYRVDVQHVSGNQYDIVLQSTSPDVRTTVTVRSRTDVSGTVSGGELVIEYDRSADELVVDDE